MDLFVSSCSYDDTVLKEFSSCSFRMRIKSPSFIVLYIILALPTILYFIAGDYPHASLFCFVWLGAITSLLLWASPTRSKSSLKNKLIHSYGDTMPMLTSSFTENGIVQYNSLTDSDKEWSYKGITKLVETEHLFIVYMGDGSACIVDKRGFTKGNPSDFKAYMENKCQ